MKLDEYATSMFRFERINAAWVTRCADYLREVFGNAIKGATVVDYAFGRGNWSLAFREAGAARVIAIDASASNVAKFAQYVAAENITGIEVILGNILEAPIAAEADILWVYGILPCIPDQPAFLKAITGLWSTNGAGLGLLYAYNDASLRQTVIDIARSGVVYDSYASFLDDSPLYSHHARMRARDDLTAPYVNWHSSADMATLLRDAGAVPVKQVASFGGFEGTENPEFCPHHVLFARDGNPFIAIDTPADRDTQLLGQLGNAIMDASPSDAQKKIAIGLLNTHFDALAHGGYAKALFEDFLYLFYLAKTFAVMPTSEAVQALLAAAEHALGGAPVKTLPSPLQGSSIAATLAITPIRI